MASIEPAAEFGGEARVAERLLLWYLPVESRFTLPEDSYFDGIGPVTVRWLDEMSRTVDPAEVAGATGYSSVRSRVRFIAVEEGLEEATGLRSAKDAWRAVFSRTAAREDRMSTVTGTRVVAEVWQAVGGNLIDLLLAGAVPSVAASDVESLDGRTLGPLLNLAVEAVRRVQESYIAVTRVRTRLLSLEHLPPVIPFRVQPLDDMYGGELSAGLFLNERHSGGLGDVAKVDISTLNDMNRVSELAQPSMPYVATYNNALVTLHVEGNYQAAVLLAAVAAEEFLNDVVCALRWEEGDSPESSAQSWSDSLKVRVRRELAARLGGNWSLEGSGPFQEWWRNAYVMRGRVIHGNYFASYSEARRSIDTLDRMISWVGDLLTRMPKLRSYPRTASIFYSSRIADIRERQSWLRELQEDSTQPNWGETLSRWIDVHDRILRSIADSRSPQSLNAELFSTWRKGELVAWVLADVESGLACRVNVDANIVVLPPDLLRSEGPGLTQVLHVRIPGDVEHPVGPWVEEYHLCVGRGVMVGGPAADLGGLVQR